MGRRPKVADETATQKSKILVDRDEYKSLCELRDGLFTETEAKLRKLQNDQQSLLVTNREQLERLLKYDRAIDQYRVSVKHLEERDKILSTRVSTLEAELHQADEARSKAERETAGLEAIRKAIKETANTLEAIRSSPKTMKVMP